MDPPRYNHLNNFYIKIFDRTTGVSSDKEIGCDVEIIKKPRLDIAKRFFTENEMCIRDSGKISVGDKVLFDSNDSGKNSESQIRKNRLDRKSVV